MAHLEYVQEAVDSAVDWVFARLDRFSPFDDSDAYVPSRLKSFAEFAIMLAPLTALVSPPASIKSHAIELLDKASARPEFTDWIIRAPDILVQYVQICAALRVLGFDSPELRCRIQSAVDAGSVEQLERVPHRSLELSLSLDWAGIAHSMQSAEELVEMSILSAALRAPLLSRDTVYAITHVIMFCARFGLNPCSLGPKISIDRVRELICDLLVAACQDDDWDVLGELLLCWDCLGFAPTPVTAAAWNTFLSARTPNGSFLGRPPKENPKSADGGTAADGAPDVASAGKPAEDQAFDDVYHTTLVAILAGSLHLHRAQQLGLP